jgi:phosphoserine phosphatase
MRYLFVFDMDGTLLPETTASLEIAKATDTLPELIRMEADFKRGILDAPRFAERAYELWRHLDVASYRGIFEGTLKIGNIRRTLEAIRNRGSRSCLLTLSSDLYAEHFFEYGFDFILASKFPRDADARIERGDILDAHRKPELVRELCRDIGISMENVVAFGDGLSDLPLFEAAGISVFVNADPGVRGKADLHYEGADIYEAYSAAVRLLERSA